MLRSNLKRSEIAEVQNIKTGATIKEVDFFSQSPSVIFNQRRLQQDVAIICKQQDSHIPNGEWSVFVCLYCKQIVSIKGSKNGKLFFAHWYKSGDCLYKTDSKLTKKEIEIIRYNGQKEGILHITLKNLIAQYLTEAAMTGQDIKDVLVEKTVMGVAVPKKWRRPDVQCVYDYKKIVLELQISSTWISVIAEREAFYKTEGVFVLWVFNEFFTDSCHQKFTQKDIIYPNNRNAFVFDNDAIGLSKKHGELILNCYYQVPYITEQFLVEERWVNKFVTLSELTFDADRYIVYYRDSDSEFMAAEKTARDKRVVYLAEQARKQNIAKHGNLYLVAAKNIGQYIGLGFNHIQNFGIANNGRNQDFYKLVYCSEMDYLCREHGGYILYCLANNLQENLNAAFNYGVDRFAAPQGSIFPFIEKSVNYGILRTYSLCMQSGYAHVQSDMKMAEAVIKKNQNKDIVEILVLLRLLSKLGLEYSSKICELIIEARSVLFCIASILMNTVIGSGHAKVISTINTILRSKYEHKFNLDIVIAAVDYLSKYGNEHGKYCANNILSYDSYHESVAIYKSKGEIEAQPSFNWIYRLLFPDIYNFMQTQSRKNQK